jgi:hypothetical protein
MEDQVDPHLPRTVGDHEARNVATGELCLENVILDLNDAQTLRSSTQEMVDQILNADRGETRKAERRCDPDGRRGKRGDDGEGRDRDGGV